MKFLGTMVLDMPEMASEATLSPQLVQFQKEIFFGLQTRCPACGRCATIGFANEIRAYFSAVFISFRRWLETEEGEFQKQGFFDTIFGFAVCLS
jgi:hypothetical protein